MEQLKRELEAVGFYLSAHPLDAYDKVMDRLGVVRAGDLAAKLEREGAAGLKLAGTLIAKQERRSAKGQPVRLCPALRSDRRVRGHAVLRNPVPGPRSAGSRASRC